MFSHSNENPKKDLRSGACLFSLLSFLILLITDESSEQHARPPLPLSSGTQESLCSVEWWLPTFKEINFSKRITLRRDWGWGEEYRSLDSYVQRPGVCAGSALAVEKLLEFPDPFWFSARLAWELRMDYGGTEAHPLRGCQTAVLPPAVPLHSGYRQERSQGGLMRTGMLGSS